MPNPEKYDEELQPYGLMVTPEHRQEHIEIATEGDGVCDFCDGLLAYLREES
jgi:hypothetical protein